MISLVATAVALQLEAGAVKMSSAPDDFWYEQALPHHTGFTTAALGAGLRFDWRPVQLSLGWRTLGNQHQSAQIIGDADYFRCRGSPHSCPKTSAFWTETGNESQAYAELGYAFRLPANWQLVPSVGFAETHIGSHVDMYRYPSLKREVERDGTPYICSASPQNLPKLFYGITAQHGGLGVGVDLLNTEPNRGANNCSSPIQGSSALYFRVTYAFGL